MEKKEYCHKHGRGYFYVCPDCAEEMKRVDAEREERKRKWKDLLEDTVWLPEVNNPSLLQVKMFLAGFTHITNMPYDSEEHNCAHFAHEIQEKASRLGIRCGYVVIMFKDREMGHAIVAFETDYGLKFFEPQNANEVDVIVGHYYSAMAEGIPENPIVSRVEIAWNDRTKTQID